MNSKKNKILLFIGVVVLGLFVSLVSFTHFVRAAEIKEGDEEQLTVKVDEEVINDDLYLAGMNVIVDSNVKGDLYVAGQNIDINGDVEGKVFATGLTVDINSDVYESVVVFCQTLNVNGVIGRNLYFGAAFVNLQGKIQEDIFGSGATVEMDSEAKEDVYLAAGQLMIKKDIAEDAFLSGALVDLQGDIGGDAFVGTDKLQAGEVNVGGDLTLYSENKLNVPKGVKVEGNKKVNLIQQVDKEAKTSKKVEFNPVQLFAPFSILGIGFKVFQTFLGMLGYIVLGFLALNIMPVKIKDSVDKLRQGDDILRSLLIGVSSIPVGLFLVLILFVVGPVLKVVVALATIAWTLAIPVSGIVVGEKVEELLITGDKKNYLRSLIIGIILIQLISLIPVLGVVVRVILILMGVGAMIRMQWNKYRHAKNLN